MTYNLNGLRKVTEEELRRFIAGKDRPKAELPTPPTRNVAMGRPSRNDRSEFRILDHVGKVRKVGRNYVTRCPAARTPGTTGAVTTWPS